MPTSALITLPDLVMVKVNLQEVELRPSPSANPSPSPTTTTSPNGPIFPPPALSQPPPDATGRRRKRRKQQCVFPLLPVHSPCEGRAWYQADTSKYRPPLPRTERRGRDIVASSESIPPRSSGALGRTKYAPHTHMCVCESPLSVSLISQKPGLLLLLLLS